MVLSDTWDNGLEIKGNVELFEKAIQISVNLSIPEVHRTIAENPNFDPTIYFWHVRFSIKPEISKSDLQDIGIVERMKYERKISSLWQTAVEHIQACAKGAHLVRENPIVRYES